MRTDLSAAFQAQITATRGRPIFLAFFGLPSGAVRYTTNPDPITHLSQTWTPQDFRISALRFDGTGNNQVTVVFENVTKVWAALFRQAGTEGSLFALRVSDGLLTAADFLDPLSSLRVNVSSINQVNVGTGAVTIVCKRQKIIAPTDRCDAAHGFLDVTAPGVSQFPAGAQVLN